MWDRIDCYLAMLYVSNFLIIIYLNWYFITDNGGSAQGVDSDGKRFGNPTHSEKLAGMGSKDN